MSIQFILEKERKHWKKTFWNYVAAFDVAEHRVDQLQVLRDFLPFHVFRISRRVQSMMMGHVRNWTVCSKTVALAIRGSTGLVKATKTSGLRLCKDQSRRLETWLMWLWWLHIFLSCARDDRRPRLMLPITTHNG